MKYVYFVRFLLLKAWEPCILTVYCQIIIFKGNNSEHEILFKFSWIVL